MAKCVSPKKGFLINARTTSDIDNPVKFDYFVTDYDVDHLEYSPVKRAWQKRYTSSSVLSEDNPNLLRDFIEVPCKKCIACRMSYARSWADRCLMELKMHRSAYFITLTIDDAHMVDHYRINSTKGISSTLLRSDLQNFMKSLRKKFPPVLDENKNYVIGDDGKYVRCIRYFACGEYGSQRMRPHYHVICFGLELNDLKEYKKNELGQMLYTSKTLSDIWGKGFVIVGNVTWNSCAYTARYILKKQTGPSAVYYEENDILPEFTAMSLKPAIGYEFYQQHKDTFYTQGFVSIPTEEGGRDVYPPPYFDRLYKEENPLQMKEIKRKRMEYAIQKDELEMQKTDLNKAGYNKVRELNLVQKNKKLKRSVEDA